MDDSNWEKIKLPNMNDFSRFYFSDQKLKSFPNNIQLFWLKEFDKVFQKFNEASVLTHKALILPSLQILTSNLGTK